MYKVVYTWEIVVKGGKKTQQFVSFALLYFLNDFGWFVVLE